MADILLVDDQDRYIELCRKSLPHHRYRGPARNLAEALEILSRARGRVDLVLLDVHFDISTENLIGFEPGMSERAVVNLKRRQGVEILKALRARYPDLPVVLMTSRDEVALEVVADPAQDFTYFLDDDEVDASSLSTQIDAIMAGRRGRESEGPIFWGKGLQMRSVRRQLEILALGRLPVVLLGPTGTGKSLIARHFVHERSGRKGRFVAVDLSTLPSELMSAHLFGSVRGAYTGSVADRVGAFEAADNGTLFLDEVGNLTVQAQKMLLSVLQEGRITRLGDLKERSVDVKVVVATNEDLRKRVAEGTFRADLYMRFNPATSVTLPSLVEREHDLKRLIAFSVEGALKRPYLQGLIEEHAQRHRLDVKSVEVQFQPGEMPDDALGLLFPERTLRLLRGHRWPGNLREFAMTIENAVLFALAETAGASRGPSARVVQIRPKLVRDLLAAAPSEVQMCDGQTIQVALRAAPSLNKVAQECERQYFEQLYLLERGDFSAMASVLLGDPEGARKVQLRFNQLGLKVRELKARLS